MQTSVKFSPVNIDERSKLDIRSGDTVRVWVKIEEKGKTRLQPFEGLVLARKHGREPGATFTVRKISQSVGVERIFPLYSPIIDKIEVIRRAKSRRAKLYFLRRKTAKEIRRKMKAFADFVSTSYEEEKPEPEPEPETETTTPKASTPEGVGVPNSPEASVGKETPTKEESKEEKPVVEEPVAADLPAEASAQAGAEAKEESPDEAKEESKEKEEK